ncbi:hypothetical protein BDA99DRAFT_290550 [Phascolomyces articulosus]|uniref:Uncharacterized protein n=1 Tax=Phascolomyces articulosus TaxID=60185 RepID=A0AAD5JLR0_9FUNG|nr:hypothetical protein BDA99DRAFT_290550 [Phascolomyces articulosus]
MKSLSLFKKPEDQCIQLIKRTQTQEQFKAVEIEKIYNKLKPVEAISLLGEWKYGLIDTNSIYSQLVKKVKLVGKKFSSLDKVEPVIVLNEQGERISSNFWGYAKIKNISHRGITTAALEYDRAPLFEYYRYVDENTILGIADFNGQDDMDNTDKYVYFYMSRLSNAAPYFESRL